MSWLHGTQAKKNILGWRASGVMNMNDLPRITENSFNRSMWIKFGEKAGLQESFNHIWFICGF